MATRIAFSTHYPDRMKELAGKPTYFVERIWTGLKYENHREKSVLYNHYRRECRIITGKDWDNEYPNIMWQYPPKTTAIRSNYEYWKSKEGQLIQPFFWAGRPYHSKQVVFCPEVRLKRVRKVEIDLWKYTKIIKTIGEDVVTIHFSSNAAKQFTQNEGFDHPDHFWIWFDKDTEGALLVLESVEG